MDRISQAQEELHKYKLAGWLLYDFRGNNPFIKHFIQVNGFLSRRLFMLIPVQGRPKVLIHAIEAGAVAKGPYDVETYSSWQSLKQTLERLLPQGKIALEYSENCDLPYISTVDAGTVEMLRSLGANLVSSANISQIFGVWSKEQVDWHLQAVDYVQNARDLAFEFLSFQTRLGHQIRETEVQKVITDYFDQHKLIYDHPPIVGFAAHSADPHYAPLTGKDAVLKEGDAILIDLWAKLPYDDAPYADITWMGSFGAPSNELVEVFSLVAKARDIAVDAIQKAYIDGGVPKGKDIDQVTRAFITEKGYGEAFIHRTGHSLGTQHTHGEAVHLDDFETRDTRDLRPGIAVTVEPGIYLKAFGVRSEINLIVEEQGPKITTQVQKELLIVAFP